MNIRIFIEEKNLVYLNFPDFFSFPIKINKIKRENLWSRKI